MVTRVLPRRLESGYPYVRCVEKRPFCGMGWERLERPALKYFHCQPDLVEDVSRLVGALRDQGILLDVGDDESLAVGELEGEIFCILVHRKRFWGNLSVREFPSLLPLWNSSPAAERIRNAFHALGIAAVDSPAEAEIKYVEIHFDQTNEVCDLILKIRQQRQMVEIAVTEQRFEEAACAADTSDDLLDRLYDTCRL